MKTFVFSLSTRLSLFLIFCVQIGSHLAQCQELGVPSPTTPTPTPTKVECDRQRFELRRQMMEGLGIKNLTALHQLVSDNLKSQDIADLTHAAKETKWHLHFQAKKDFMNVGQRILDGRNVFDSHTFARKDVVDEKIARARYEAPDGHRETILFVKPELQVGIRVANPTWSQLPAFKNANSVVATLLDDFSTQPADQTLVISIDTGEAKMKYTLGELVEKNLAINCQNKDLTYTEDFNSIQSNDVIRKRGAPKASAGAAELAEPGSR